MKEFYNKLPKAREALPLKALLEQHGGFCPWCEQQSAYVTEEQQKLGRVLDSSVEEVKDRTDIVEFIRQRVDLKPQQANFVGLCPFHHERSPSFTVYPKTKSYHCFGCKASGSVINFVMGVEGLKFMEAVKKLAEVARVELRYDVERQRQVFNCMTKDCPSKREERAGQLDELDYLRKAGKLSAHEALLAYLKQAGVLKDETLPPSIMPGQRARKRRTTSLSEDGSQSPPPPAPAIEPDRRAAAAEPVPPVEAGAAVVAMACTSRQGEVVCGKVAAWKHPQFVGGAFCEECKTKASEFFPNNWLAIDAEESPKFAAIANDEELEGVLKGIKKIKQKIGTAKAFGKVDPKDEESLRTAEMAVAAYEAGKAKAKTMEAVAAKESHEWDGYEALREFFAKLTLISTDEEAIFRKRALTSQTIGALAFRSNLMSNRELLLGLGQAFPWDELRRSGLWLPEAEGKERRPNVQYSGFGQIAKKPRELRKNKDDKWVWGFPDQGWCGACKKLFKATQCEECGGALKFCHPILIPYFNRAGELVKLRPHKGGASAGTAAGSEHLYIPRATAASGIKNGDRYNTVIITEGEFKAAALWQTVGDGAQLTDAYGVCAIPGINFAKSFELREELHGWLTSVRCREVIVAFDDEEKGDPKLPGFNRNPKARHDAQIWARYLATDLAQKLHVRGKVCVLPREWRNADGKSDWDGALAKLTHGE